MIPALHAKFHVLGVRVDLWLNLLAFMFGFALFTNAVQLSFGPVAILIAIGGHE